MNLIRSYFTKTDQELSTQETLRLIGLAGLAALVITLTPGLNLLNYPFTLLVTFVHEFGHGLAGLLTGGQFVRFVVFPDGSGRAYVDGGWSWVINPAGYLGVALFGAGLILLGRSHRWSRVALGVIGGTMIWLTIGYGRPAGFSPQEIIGGMLTIIFGLIFGLALLQIAVRASQRGIIFGLHFVAFQAGLNAVFDFVYLIGISRQPDAPHNDAQAMAELTSIPAVVWAVGWALLALYLIVGAIALTWARPDDK